MCRADFTDLLLHLGNFLLEINLELQRLLADLVVHFHEQFGFLRRLHRPQVAQLLLQLSEQGRGLLIGQCEYILLECVRRRMQ